jgi:hypothetical protein
MLPHYNIICTIYRAEIGKFAVKKWTFWLGLEIKYKENDKLNVATLVYPEEYMHDF